MCFPQRYVWQGFLCHGYSAWGACVWQSWRAWLEVAVESDGAGALARASRYWNGCAAELEPGMQASPLCTPQKQTTHACVIFIPTCAPAKLRLKSFAGAVYFVQGILGLSRLGVTYLYKDEFHLDPASVSRPASLLRVLLERLLVACSGICCSI